jgi:hypothetical protein
VKDPDIILPILENSKDCDMPPFLLAKERIGKSGRDLDIERRIKLNPDLFQDIDPQAVHEDLL